MDRNAVISLVRELIEGIYVVKLSDIDTGIDAFRNFYEQGLPPFISVEYKKYFSEKIQDLPKPYQIIHYCDVFEVHYMLMNAGDGRTLVFGPYSPQEIDDNMEEQILERSLFTTRLLTPFHLYIQSLPVCKNTTLIFVAKTLYSQISGRDLEPFYVECHLSAPEYLRKKESQGILNETNDSMINLLEKRYALSRKFYNEIYSGNQPKAEQIYLELREVLKSLKRTTNPLRNQKNLAFVQNTGLRRTVERTGIHPVYIDKVSTYYAIEIENSSSVSRLEHLELEMIRTYCDLVIEHSLKQYPPFSRKIIQYLHFHLSDSIRLDELAAFAGVSPSYLSRRFNLEVKMSIPNYVNKLRCNKAAHLLECSQDNIDDIAYYVGYTDIGYFYKQFKKYYGMLPGMYQNKNG